MLLCGNHDLPYYALRPACINGSNQFNKELSFSLNDGPSNDYKVERARIINGIWDETFWQSLKGAYLFDGWLFSHAGIKRRFWRKTDSLASSYELFCMGWQSAWNNMHTSEEKNAFFSCGTVRGGESEYGGPLWLDWRKEFDDELELPQIVGHTRLTSENEMQKGRCYCLDFSQRAYGKLIDGKLTLIRLKR
ncbi:hypothetical protein QEH52_00105 [Coraliomargarita sp. SDUM461003]|uniref:Calcineurin-like phosphoesterase domain-containing protein n=1 Tax=Thalassobacterium maritimum TaxID=3041265 RepID=A0ABU1AP71_9BACT|nr:hypothetical protein [Coraliomargarita sp. SDUM461003]MDQ8205896.1 hypothetical protein [Coraliomargarita sp. SDUM461003]